MLGEDCRKANLILFKNIFLIQQYKNCVIGRKVTVNIVQLKFETDCQDLIDGAEEKTCKYRSVV